jgi:hypothetical protein
VDVADRANTSALFGRYRTLIEGLRRPVRLTPELVAELLVARDTTRGVSIHYAPTDYSKIFA